MFKNLIVYRIGPQWSQSLDSVSNGLDSARFAPCGTSQPKSVGWIEPRGEVGAALAEAIDGHWIMKFRIETKIVPSSVINRITDERKVQIEAETGRKPGKKETTELKEAVTLELLPMAFSKFAAVTVWIDTRARLLMLDATGQSTIDEVITSLIKQLEGLAITPIQTKASPAASMAEWLVSQEPPVGFTVDRECELKATDDTKAVVRYAHHALDIDEIREHISQGKQPTRLAMTWTDRVSFVLNDQMNLKKIAFLEGVFEKAGAAKDEGFDADVAIACGELSQMIPELIDALGGESDGLGDGAVAATAGSGGSADAEVAPANETSAEAPAVTDRADAPF